MNCMDALEKVMNNGGMPDMETLEHINMCPHCKKLGDDWAKLSAVEAGEEREIPRNIEESILSAAHCYAEKRSRKTFTILKWPVISSAAACIVFSLTTLLYLNLKEEAPSPQAANSLQVISQNEKWNSIDMTLELDKFKSEIEAHISELAMPAAPVDMSSLTIREPNKNLS